MTTQLTFSEFKNRRLAHKATQAEYLQSEENEGVIELSYRMYLKGRVPAYAKN